MLLKELVRLHEEAIEDRTAEDVWAEGKDESKTYISNTTYYARVGKNGQYEVVVSSGTSRKPFAMLDKVELDKSFTPVRANQEPDAEGFTQYRKVDEAEAIQFTGDTCKVGGILINKGDYLVRTADGNDFKYEVKKARDFEANYTEK